MRPPPFAATLPAAQEVLEFWLDDALELGWPSQNRSAIWFRGGEAMDRTIRDRFGAHVDGALAGGLQTWETQPLDRLALVLVLDQFTRNVHRGQAEAFAGDTRAQALVMDALAQGWQDELPLAGKVFLYMPLMHAEDLALQDECVRRFERLHADASPERRETLKGNLDFAIEHRDIIARFGRFPYRNAALGRSNSAEETVFLEHGPRFGQ